MGVADEFDLAGAAPRRCRHRAPGSVERSQCRRPGLAFRSDLDTQFVPAARKSVDTIQTRRRPHKRIDHPPVDEDVQPDFARTDLEECCRPFEDGLEIAARPLPDEFVALPLDASMNLYRQDRQMRREHLDTLDLTRRSKADGRDRHRQRRDPGHQPVLPHFTLPTCRRCLSRLPACARTPPCDRQFDRQASLRAAEPENRLSNMR